MKGLILLGLLCLTPRLLAPAIEPTERWIIWNVGQGLWTTYLTRDFCHHVDLGGEFFPRRKIQRLCSHRQNVLRISHWDWDHLGGVRSLKKWTKLICIAALPRGEPKQKSRRRLFEKLSPCESTLSNDFRELHSDSLHFKNTNAASRVWLWKNRWLFPGDSPRQEEIRWSRKLAPDNRIHTLIAGHHGSRTSTSTTLLKRLPQLRLVIVSARQKVYGHPHPKVIARLQKRKIPILRTEEWGHLIFEL